MLKNIVELAEQFETVEDVKAELKRVQSVKCRLKKQKARADYEQEMQKTVAYEQALKEVRDYKEPKRVTYTTMDDEQIALLNYDETIKAIKSVQSKKCNAQYSTENIEDNVEYQAAVALEEKLLAHKKLVKPIDETVVKKSQIADLIETLSNLEKLEKDYVIDQLKGLLA